MLICQTFSRFFPAKTVNREDDSSSVIIDHDNYRLLCFYSSVFIKRLGKQVYNLATLYCRSSLSDVVANEKTHRS